MKKLVCFLVLAAMAAGSSYAGYPARTGITGSVHDMNEYVGAEPDVYGRSCVFCHTPHNAMKSDDEMEPLPLWNHDFSQLDFSDGVYIWATPLNESLVINDPLVGPSRLCMSCHDGSVAIDQHGPSRRAEGTLFLTGDVAVGQYGDLTDDHPIGFSYGDALIARNTEGLLSSGTYGEVVGKEEKFASSVTPSENSGTYDTVVRDLNGRTIGDVLYQGDIFTCASCHEVHNKESVIQRAGTDGTTPNYLLYAEEYDSLICLSCHVK